MSSTPVARCLSERHEHGYATPCQLPAEHEGPHWALATGTFGGLVHAWTGDDREEETQ